MKWTKNEIDLLIAHGSEHTIAEWGSILGRTPDNVRDKFSYFAKCGIGATYKRVNAKMTEEDKQFINELRKSGLTCAELAEKFECNRQTITANTLLENRKRGRNRADA